MSDEHLLGMQANGHIPLHTRTRYKLRMLVRWEKARACLRQGWQMLYDLQRKQNLWWLAREKTSGKHELGQKEYGYGLFGENKATTVRSIRERMSPHLQRNKLRRVTSVNNLHVVTFRKKVRDLSILDHKQSHSMPAIEDNLPKTLGLDNLVHKSTLLTDQQPSKRQFWRFDCPYSRRPLSFLLQFLHEILRHVYMVELCVKRKRAGGFGGISCEWISYQTNY